MSLIGPTEGEGMRATMLLPCESVVLLAIFAVLLYATSLPGARAWLVRKPFLLFFDIIRRECKLRCIKVFSHKANCLFLLRAAEFLRAWPQGKATQINDKPQGTRQVSDEEKIALHVTQQEYHDPFPNNKIQLIRISSQWWVIMCSTKQIITANMSQAPMKSH